MKRVAITALAVCGIFWAGISLGQGGFVHPGGAVTLPDGTAGHAHPGGAVTFSDGTTGFVHPGGAVTTSDGRSGFLHPGGVLDLPPKTRRESGEVPAKSKKKRGKRSGKPAMEKESKVDYVWQRIPETKKAPEQPKKAKIIEIHKDGTVTESYH